MPALLALAAVLAGLPVVVHLLLKQKPTPVPFPAVRFLLAAAPVTTRKIRLQHFLLLFLRCLLVGLFGLTLFQPRVFSEGLLNFAAEQPVNAVLVLDTSPSMGYAVNTKTRLDDAIDRANEFLDDLPSESRVAVIDPADPAPGWEASVADARKKLAALKPPKGVAMPVTAGLAAAYRLLKAVDAENEGEAPRPRIVAVFTDRAAAAWDASRADDLKKLKDAVPAPPVGHLVIDVGVEAPANVAITGVEMKPQIVPAGKPLAFTATVTAAGPAVPDMLVTAHCTTPNVPDQKKVVALPAGTPTGVNFAFDNLPPGVHQFEITLDKDRKDALPADDVRYLTARVVEPRKILTLCDDPPVAAYWQIAHEAVGEFSAEVRKPADAGEFTGFAAVCLLSVADATPLWPKLLAYAEAGGQIVIIPGGDDRLTGYAPTTDAAARILPGTLKAVFDTDTLADADLKKFGAPLRIDDAALRHPLFKPFREWKLRGTVDVVNAPRRAWKYWDAEVLPDAAVVVRYDDADNDAARHPAILERKLGRGGRVLLLTTRLDLPRARTDVWNNYWDTENSWHVVFPNLLLRYLCGDPAEAEFNFNTGPAVPLAPPPGVKKLRLEGPGLTERDAEIAVAEKQTEVRVSATTVPGNFRAAGPGWADGFSLNPPADESTLDKVSADAVEAVTGPGSVVPVGKAVKLRDAITTAFDQPVELFPWLLILVLVLIAGEGLVANYFSRA